LDVWAFRQYRINYANLSATVRPLKLPEQTGSKPKSIGSGLSSCFTRLAF
jgi:hypothetical protein